MSGATKKDKLTEILDSAIMVGGQIPSIFWDLDITGKELRVLNYVWSNILRLYESVKNTPKGIDHTPRYWKNKEAMATECKMSFPTFRNSVRNLKDLGLVTSMDSKSVFDDLHSCIGLSPKYFDGLNLRYKPELDKSSNQYKLHLILDIIPQLYDKETVKLVHDNFKKLLKLELENKELKKIVDNLQFIGCQDQLDENGEIQTVACWTHFSVVDPPKHLKKTYLSGGWVGFIDPTIAKTPIQVERVVCNSDRVKLDINEGLRQAEIKSKSEKVLARAKEFRDKNFVLSKREEQVMTIAHYYEYKCRVVNGVTGWKCLGKNFREHKNWKFLNRIYDLCETHGYDYKIYIDAQFDRASYWKRSVKYPYLNQFFSEGALSYYKSYIKDCRENYSPTGDAKIKTSVPQSYIQDIADSIVKDCDNFLAYVKLYGKGRKLKGLTPEQVKLLYVLDHVLSLSPYYWASLPWSIPYLQSFNNPMVEEVITKVVQYQKSKAIMSVITQVVTEVEQHLGIVPTVSPMKN